MTQEPTVFHDVTMQALPRRLPRNEPVQSVTITALQSADTTPAVATAVQAVLVDTGTSTQHHVAVEDISANAFASGFQEGYQKAKQDADKEVRRLAEQLAIELAKEKVQQAYEQASEEAKRLAEKTVKNLQAQWQLKLTQLGKVLEHIPIQFTAYLADAEDDMLALAYEVVCRILGEEGASLPGLRAQLQQCLKAWHGHALLNIELHPDDLALLQTDEESLRLLKIGGFSAERSTLRWVADPRVKLGGCRLRSVEGILDARLEVQFKALEATLLSTRASRRHLASMERAT